MKVRSIQIPIILFSVCVSFSAFSQNNQFTINSQNIVGKNTEFPKAAGSDHLFYNGESIFEPSFPKRDGISKQYTKSKDFNNYHISYYATGKDNRAREISHLRKNMCFEKVLVGQPKIPVHSAEIHKVKLLKNYAQIQIFIVGRKIIDWTDDGKKQPVWQDGKMEFRQMQWTHFRYRNFKVWEYY
jgi:hypothetical protein